LNIDSPGLGPGENEEIVVCGREGGRHKAVPFIDAANRGVATAFAAARIFMEAIRSPAEPGARLPRRAFEECARRGAADGLWRLHPQQPTFAPALFPLAVSSSQMSGLSDFAEVALPLAIQETLTYSIPEELKGDVRLGSRVEVPVGPRLSTGFVIGLVDSAPVAASKMRKIRAVLDDEEPALTPEIIELCRWAASYYMAPLGEMLRVALPANMGSRGKRDIRSTATEELTAKALAESRIVSGDLLLLAEVTRRGTLPFKTALESAKGARQSIARLRDAGLVTVSDQLRDATGVRYDRFVVLEMPIHDLPTKQQAVVDLLADRGGDISHAALTALGMSDSSIATLARKGVVRLERRARRHTLDAFLSELSAAPAGEIDYSQEQRQAISRIRGSIGTFRPFLLEGVTGSGKTEVYIELMREVVRRGDQALLLVPEIALTPVFAARLKERFGERIAILHSNLTASERYDQWWKARRGEVDVAIGPRSALFTPFGRLGLVVVDEEGDGAYKQEETPRYNARDLAVVRARLLGIPIVLGSATPSLESRENAERGRYDLIRLTHRVEARPLPEVEVVDIRKERGEKEDRGLVVFSSRLRQELQRVFELGEQAILLMNRRGYAPFLLCRQCENDFRCLNCSVTLTVHRRIGQLICHYCGARKGIPSVCPLCSGEVLQPIGFGTEKVEERFRQYFPGVSVEVLDRDSTRKKGELVRILDRFRRGETSALIGTQMISKGHHFPDVTLTGVISGDAILGYPDFRAAEKTFYLLTQVAGRSGRGRLKGKVCIQTAFPNHYAIQHAVHHDYEAFFASEIEFRRTFHYPPITSMIALLFRGQEEKRVEKASSEAATAIEGALGDGTGVRIQGPAPAPLARIKGVFRYQILLRGSERNVLRRALEQALHGRKWPGVELTIDVDPINIL
jgi:primosomal protein N' (replication factor Y)